MNNAIIEEIAGNWEVMAEMEDAATDAALAADGAAVQKVGDL